ncbi:SURF1 family protein [Nocardioides sp. CFH 31398]|uniref:SURF1 family protein n=1 Tax=Nocardioides sp. CFH 31398 TaxID=2919579 RepID=UPI001F0562B9|nr:SURF1 family protein [Nocardioides sp. CFH 31398]MCH1865681.1 SURF1 family protein [Nocardioides sp. CFH 31398]
MSSSPASPRDYLAPRLLLAHVVALVLVSIAVALGFWQLGAWSAEREAQAVDLTQEAPRPIADVVGPDDGFPADALGRPLEVTGTWVPEGSLVVTGRSTAPDEPGDGVWAVTPVAVDAADAELLVVRGWAPSADGLPEAPSGPVDLVVRMQPSQAEPGVADPDPSDAELPQLRIADAVQLTEADLYGGYGVAAEPTPGLEAVRVPANAEVGPFTGLQNLLYAVEWWVFGAFAAVVWWRSTRDAVLAGRAAAEAGEGDDEDAGQGAGPTPVGSSS